MEVRAAIEPDNNSCWFTSRIMLSYHYYISQDSLSGEWWHPQWAGPSYVNQDNAPPPSQACPKANLIWTIPQLRIPSQMTLPYAELTIKASELSGTSMLLCEHINLYVAYMCMLMPEVNAGVFLDFSLPCLLKQGLLLNWSSPAV